MKYKKILIALVATVLLAEGSHIIYAKTQLSNNLKINSKNDKVGTTIVKKQEKQKVDVLKKDTNAPNGVQKQSVKSDSIKSDSITEKLDKKKVIVIDPGHGKELNLEKEQIAPETSEMKIKDGGGAQGQITGIPEYVVNMEVALKLRKALQEKGFTVVLTKENINESLGNIERAQVGNKVNASLVIRIHADSNDNNSVKGASMLVPAPINKNTKSIYKESSRCGQVILNTLVSQVGMKNRGIVERNDMTGFNWSTVPVVLIEMGFLSNAEEDKLLNTEEYQSKISKALADGIGKALNNKENYIN